MESKDILQECRHDARNALVNIYQDIKEICAAVQIIDKALIDLANERARIERAINFLDGINHDDKG